MWSQCLTLTHFYCYTSSCPKDIPDSFWCSTSMWNFCTCDQLPLTRKGNALARYRATVDLSTAIELSKNCCCNHKTCPVLILGLVFLICSLCVEHLKRMANMRCTRIPIYNPTIQCQPEESSLSQGFFLMLYRGVLPYLTLTFSVGIYIYISIKQYLLLNTLHK